MHHRARALFVVISLAFVASLHGSAARAEEPSSSPVESSIPIGPAMPYSVIGPGIKPDESAALMSSMEGGGEAAVSQLIRTVLPQADDASGALLQEYPIRVPPGRNGLQPDLTLRYSSQASHVDGWIAQGWDITIPVIERRNKRGIDTLYTYPSLTTSFSGELVEVASGTYATRYENGDFYSYAFDGTSWTVKDKKGSTYLFGSASSSRMFPAGNEAKVSKWFLAEIRDQNDNFVRYEYTRDQDQVYPSRIVYTGHGATDGPLEVEFVWESRANAPKQFHPAFQVKSAYRLSEIRTEVNGSWVRKYALGYGTADGGGRPLLSSITESGRDEVTGTLVALPAQSHSYQSASSGWTLDTSITWPSFTECAAGGSSTFRFADASGNDLGRRVLDVNGDALPDILIYLGGACNDIGALINNGDGTWTQDNDWNPPVPFIDTNGNDRGARFAEVNGDGLIDIVYSSSLDGQGVYINHGNGWSLSTTYVWPTDGSAPLRFAVNGAPEGVRVLDVNGDGLSDIVKNDSANGSGAWINKGDGLGWQRDNDWIPPVPLGTGSGSDTYGAQFEDYNGDGLIDLLFKSTNGSGVYLNDGEGWTQDAGYSIPSDMDTATSSGYSTGVWAMDLNGDGFGDLVKSQYNGSSHIKNACVNKGDGTGWTCDDTYSVPLYFALSSNGKNESGTTVTDLNGDSVPDFLYGGYSFGQLSYGAYKKNGKAADAVTSTATPHGGSTSVTYKPTAQYRTGSAIANPSMPFSLQVVERTVRDDGFGNQAATLYAYEGGKLWYDSPHRKQFAGFGKITVTDAASNSVTTHYHQGDASATSTGEYLDHYSKAGKPYRTEVRDALGALFSKTIRRWDRASAGVPGAAATTTLGFSAHASWTFSGTTTQANVTTGGTSTALICGVGWNPSFDQVSGLTWNGTSTTLLNKRQTGIYSWQYLFAVLGATGTQQVAVTTSNESGTGQVDCVSYFGVSSSSFPHATVYTSGTGQASSQTITVSATGSWATIFATNIDGGWISPTVGAIGRGPVSSKRFYDTDGGIDPAGSHTVTLTNPPDHRAWGWQEIALAPASYTAAIPDNERHFVMQTQFVASDYDGDADRKDRAESFMYNAGDGNLAQRTFWGEVTGSDDGTFGDTGTDKRQLSIAYATNTNEYILSLPKSETLYDQNSSPIKESRYYYDSQSLGTVNTGNLTKKEDWKSGSSYVDVEKTYNSYGLVTTEKDPRDKTTTYAYDTLNLYPTTITNPLSHIFQRVYDYSSGMVRSATDANLLATSSVFDGLDRVLEERQPDQSTSSTSVTKTAYVYTDTSGAKRVKKTDWLDGSNGVDTWTYLDGFDRPVQIRKEAESSYATTDFDYNNRELLDRESLPYFSSGTSRTTAATNTDLYSIYAYDALKRPTSVVTGVGTTSTAYDDWKTTVTDPRGKAKHLYRDAFGRLDRVDEVNGASTYTTNYEYDANDNLTKITDALSNVRNFTYDGLNRRLTAQDLHAASDATFGTWTYGYDDAGNMTSVLDPKSQTINYTFDDLNRPLTEDFTGQSGTETLFTYDTCTYGKGKLCTAATSSATTTHLYGPIGLATRETKTISSTSYQTDTTYDRQGNALVLTLPDSSEQRNTYGAGGLLDQVERKESGGSWSDVLKSLDWSPMAQPATIVFGNSATTTNSYDATRLYRLTNKLTTSGGTNLQNVTYTYDGNGNITRLVDSSQTNAAKTLDFSYDDLNRLTGATSTNAVAGSNYTQSYVYNPIGNLTNRSDVGLYLFDGDQASSYANPHAATTIAGVSHGYDNNGNLTSSGSSTYGWDFKNRMLSNFVNGATSTYAYDQAGMRVLQVTSASTTAYASKNYSVTSSVPTKHLFAGNLLVATVEGTTSTATVRFVHTDHLTGSSVVSSATGTLVELLDYYPYGGIRLDEKASAFSETRKYAGHEFDDASGLSYMGARFYDGANARFASQDPAFLDIGDSTFSSRYKRALAVHLDDPQRLNSYSYAHNNPATLRDPDGQIVPVILAALGVYGWVSLGISAYDFKTIVIDHPDVFTTREIDAAGTSLALNGAFALSGAGANALAKTIGTEAVRLSSAFWGTLGVVLDAGQNVSLPDADGDVAAGATTRGNHPNTPATPAPDQQPRLPTREASVGTRSQDATRSDSRKTSN